MTQKMGTICGAIAYGSHLYFMEQELWADIEGFENMYQVSNFGRIRRLPHFKFRPTTGKHVFAKGGVFTYKSESGDHYPHTSLTKEQVSYNITVHIEVAKYFVLNPDPTNNTIVNHLDGNKNNPHYKNLEWITDIGNNIHARRMGLNNEVGINHSNTSFTEDQIIFIFTSALYQKELAKMFFTTQSNISCIKRGVTWSHLTGKVFKKTRLTPADAIDIFTSSLTIRELAKKYYTGESNISLIKNGKSFGYATSSLPVNISNKKRGSNYYLGVDKIVEIFKERDIGCNELARIYGIAPSTVSGIRNGKRWAEITKSVILE